MGITKSPGDRNADTPEWICITNQRINPFKSRDQEVIPRAQRKAYEVKSLYTGYICTTVAHDRYHVSVQTLRRWNREGYVRTLKQRHATMYLEADLQRLSATRRTA